MRIALHLNRLSALPEKIIRQDNFLKQEGYDQLPLDSCNNRSGFQEPGAFWTAGYRGISIVDVAVRAEFGPVYSRITDIDQAYHFVVTALVLPVKMTGVAGYVPVVKGQFFGFPGKFGVPIPYIARMIAILLV